jgi:hypothetical protein
VASVVADAEWMRDRSELWGDNFSGSEGGFMRQVSIGLCVFVVFCLCPVFVPQPQIAAANSAAPHASNSADMETGGGKPTSAFGLQDPDLFASNDAALICSNCLIRLCLVGSHNKLTGYCLEGARGGICHEDYNPTHCPPGATAKKPVLSQPCGFSGRFLVDALRSCS